MIEFNSENDFKILNTDAVEKWLKEVCAKEEKEVAELGYVFCSDEYLHNINRTYLNHNTLTDIITFDYCQGDLISGEIYISTDRVAENASIFEVDFQLELARVIVHGLLHLCGYPDKTEGEKKVMRSLEDKYIEGVKVDFLSE
ncbi:rRNA maturation RNase YbeY [Leeuwenhoekiella sp. A16]|uniref:rRNA maturation RNase YbeY n=1 Tax=unclassified Leeuwenhoekiella TaxID=2615029 RepID=UPI003A80D456